MDVGSAGNQKIVTSIPPQSHIANRYHLLERLGTGGMGEVYRAQDRLTGDTVALKRVIRKPSQNIRSTQEYHVALAQEFKLLASLRHPHIISVRDYGFDDQRLPFYTMDLLRDPVSIVDYMREKPFRIYIDLILETLQALAYLHRRGIIHRDLKPANVVVVNDGVKVLDFGLAAKAGSRSDAAGTLAYMAPESLRNGDTSMASDLYAVGLVIYEMFTGQSPFSTKNTNMLIRQVLTEMPDVNVLTAAITSAIAGDNTPTPEAQQTAQALALIVARMVMKEPTSRYQSAHDAITEICGAVARPLPEETLAIRDSYLNAAAFVGRDHEFAQLTSALQAAENGTGSAWLVIGESGVGKTRLLDELRTNALIDGMLVLTGSGALDGGFPYQLWRSVLRRLVLVTPPTPREVAVISELVPDIHTLAGIPLEDAPDLTDIARQQRLIFTIADLFQRAAAVTPILLIVEDLQWLQESLDILSELVVICTELPLLIVGSYREEERPALPIQLQEMQRLPLQRLNPDEITQLSVSMLGENGAQPPVVDLLQRETEGNVFFLIETVRLLAEAAGNLEAIGQMTLPEQLFGEGIRGVIQQRLAHVPAWAMPALQMAAIAGRELDLVLLRDAAKIEDLERWLLVGEQAFVLEVATERWQFTHDKLREMILTDLDTHTRRLHSHALAESITRLYIGDSSYARKLADLWHDAGDFDREAYYATIAGEQANQVTDSHGALQVTGRALRHIPADHTLRPNLLFIAATAHGHMTELQTAYDMFNEVYTLVSDDQDMRLKAKALDGMGWSAKYIGRNEIAREHLLASLRISEPNGYLRLAAWSLGNTGMVEDDLGNHDKAQEYLMRSLDLFHELDDLEGIGRTLNRLGWVAANQNDLIGAASYLEDALQVSKLTGDRFSIANVMVNRGFILLDLDYPDQARASLLEAARLARDIHVVSVLLEALCGFGHLALHDGNKPLALRLYQAVEHHPQKDSDVALRLDALRKCLDNTQTDNLLNTSPAADFKTLVHSVLYG